MRKLIIATMFLFLFFTIETTSQKQDIEPVQIRIFDTIEIPEPIKLNKVKFIGRFKVTAYCPCTSCSDDWGTKTSTGATATQGRTIAVDPRVIPYGTKVMFGGNTYIAEDCGGAIKENRIDLYFNSHSTALEWGVKYFNVIILETESEE